MNLVEFRFLREIRRRAILPLAAILALGAGFAIALLLGIAAHQDGVAEARSAMIARAMLEGRRAEIARLAGDYAGWGDAYEHLHKQLDVTWAYDDANFGATLFSSYGIEHVLVFDGAGKNRYAVLRGALADPASASPLSGGLSAMVEAARTASGESGSTITGLLMDGDQPVLVAASAITTGGDPKVSPQAGPPSVLMLGYALTPEKLGALGSHLALSGLGAEIRQGGGSDGEVAIATIDKSRTAVLHWTPERAGEAMLKTVLPMTVVTAAAIFGICLILLRRGILAIWQAEENNRKLVDAHDRVEHQALHDSATGLPNRAFLARAAERMLNEEAPDVAVLYLDLDRFKPVNDMHGHMVGDDVLKVVADRLTALTDGIATVSRVGGDEFTILVGGRSGVDVEALCTAIVDSIRTPIRHACGPISIGVSIGIANAPEHGTTMIELVRCADSALYEAKNGGRNQFRVFSPQMHSERDERMALEIELRSAMRDMQFMMLYQPRFEARTMTMTCVEALIRWSHPTRGVISPAAFLSVAEDSGLIVEIGEWALRTACSAVSGHAGLGVSVNVSPVQFRAKGFVEQIRRIIEETGIDAGLLELEITEGVLLEDTERAVERLGALKALGVCLAMDHFGTGYSALGYLGRFPFDSIKIDRTFVGDLATSAHARAIVNAILGLAQALDLTVTAEGVETAEQFMILRAGHCHAVQGYYFAHPMTPAEFAGRLEKDARDAALDRSSRSHAVPPQRQPAAGSQA